MMARKKSIEESWVHYLSRLDAKIDELLFDMQIVPLLGQCLLAYFGWGGHVARLADTSVCKIIHCGRDSDWLRTSQEMINTVGTGDARPMQVVGRPARAGTIVWSRQSLRLGVIWPKCGANG